MINLLVKITLGTLGLLWSVVAAFSQSAATTVQTNDGIYTIYTRSEALVIGISKYDHWKELPIVREEVPAVAAALTASGFSTSTAMDLDQTALSNALTRFLGRRTGRDTRLLVYFAGHGWTDGKSQGFIVPKDALIDEQAEGFVGGLLSLSVIRSMADTADAKHVMLVFDSCFSGSIFLARSNLTPSELFIRDADRPVRQFLTAGTEIQQVPDARDFYLGFIEGLRGAADTFKDGVVTGNELGAWLKGEITQIGNQTPQYGTDPRFEFRLGDMLFPISAQSEDASATLDRPVLEPPGTVGVFDSLIRGQGVPVDPENSIFSGLDIIYYRKLSDGRKIEDALNRKRIPFSVTAASLPEKFAVNTIACGPDVPIAALREIASTLISEGVAIRNIRTFRNPAEKPMRIELVSVTKDANGMIALDTEPLTLDQVNSLKDCPRDLRNST